SPLSSSQARTSSSPAQRTSLSLPSSASFRFFSRTYANKSRSMFNYVTTPEESDHYATELFKLVESGAVKVNFHREYPFTAEGLQQAQRDITGHSTTGKLIVKVSDE
ncbi:hypothetical protein M0805_008742, partial [Coniferiporia weirii]